MDLKTFVKSLPPSTFAVLLTACEERKTSDYVASCMNLTEEEMQRVTSGQDRVGVIMDVRYRTGMSLEQAKNLVDSFVKEHSSRISAFYT